jgi:hypothetical protein
VFTYAKNQGVLDGVHPIRDAVIPRKADAPAETHAATHAATPDEVLAIMDALDQAGEKKAHAAVALMFFWGCAQARRVVLAGKTTTGRGGWPGGKERCSKSEPEYERIRGAQDRLVENSCHARDFFVRCCTLAITRDARPLLVLDQYLFRCRPNESLLFVCNDLACVLIN